MKEIQPEDLPRALAARIECPVCDGMVRLTLGSEGPGDVGVWKCNNCNSEWYEDGTPRYQAMLSVEAIFE